MIMIPVRRASVRERLTETRDIVRLYRDEGFSCPEIARLYRVTPEAIRKRLVRAGVEMRGRNGKLKVTIEGGEL